MLTKSPRLAVRAIIISDARLLLVNAYPGRGDLWCAPGGGVENGQSLPESLQREVFEETGLGIGVGELALVNEFRDSANGFHQVELFFRCHIANGAVSPDWQDPENVVTRRTFFTLSDLRSIQLKPDSLPDVAFGAQGPARYDPIEEIVG